MDIWYNNVPIGFVEGFSIAVVVVIGLVLLEILFSILFKAHVVYLHLTMTSLRCCCCSVLSMSGVE